jgi:hypothetical protein
MMLKMAIAALILAGLYTDAQLYGAKHALADGVQRGTVTCAGKTYRDITYATMMPSGYFAIVKLWTVADHAYGEHARFSVIMNTETMCEFDDVQVRVLIENGPE